METFRTEQLPSPEGGSSRSFLIDFLQTLALALVLFLAINAVSARIKIESISMQPTLYENDMVIVNKIAYKLGKPERGDVIIFHYPPNPTIEPYIKRVIGLPGDQVQVQGGVVSVNGQALREPYIKAAPAYNGAWNVPAGALFVLGDNRNNSSDSHAWGVVPFGNVIGRAEMVYWPPQEWRLLKENIAAAAAP
jgi:signal peptidase I